MTQETCDKVKGSECIIMEGIGHFPMCENPEVFNAYLKPVLEKIQAGGRESAKGKAEAKA
jgi:pimeloyl-ACP methyl ester carboxylesterase